jgi:Alginate lyase
MSSSSTFVTDRIRRRVMSALSFAAVAIGAWASVGPAFAATLSTKTVVVPSTTGPAGFKFTHPGVLVNLDQLKYSKAKVDRGEMPWKAAFEEMRESPLAQREPNTEWMVPAAGPGGGRVLDCNRDAKGNRRGCQAASLDSAAAYTQALLWFYTQDERYAQKSAAILDAYSSTLVDHTGLDGSLFASWAAQYFVRAAEILRYTYTPSAGLKSYDSARFTAMLERAFLPIVRNDEKAVRGRQGFWNAYNSNWDLAAIDALAGIAVYLNDGRLFFSALDRWKTRVRTYVYVASDGPAPKPSPIIGRFKSEGCSWLENRADECDDKGSARQVRPVFQNGQNAETCRDFGHSGLGLAALVNTAETAWIQGVDLYALEKERIMTAFSYAAQILLYFEQNRRYPVGFCAPVKAEVLLNGDPKRDDSRAADERRKGGPLRPLADSGRQLNASEIAYNAYVVRGKEPGFRVVRIPGYSSEGIAMTTATGPQVGPGREGDPLRTLIDRYRASGKQAVQDHNAHVSLWETLTHHRVGAGQ